MAQRGKRPRRKFEKKNPLEGWVPKTQLGKMVMNNEITSMEQIYDKGLSVLEPEIIDKLLPDLKEEVLQIKMVQRTTDSGRKGSFMITAAIGNENGYVGVGTGKGKEVRPTIERAVKDAKKNIISIRRGCGSWQCGCQEEHSIPLKIKGNYSSIKIELMPAPKGTGIVAGKKASKILKLAGIKDVWSKTSGNTRTTFNFAKAVMKALKQTRKMRIIETPTSEKKSGEE